MRTSIPRPHRVQFGHSDTAVYGPEDVPEIIRMVAMTRWRTTVHNLNSPYRVSLSIPIMIYLNLGR